MANLRDIRDRIGSVKNTQQITRAMKMVAAAKLRKAQEGILAARPYAFKIREIIHHLNDQLGADEFQHPLFEQRSQVEKVLVIVITADRGLAGAFNTNIIKLAENTINEDYASHRDAGNLTLVCMGRKGHEYFSKRGYTLLGDHRGVFNKLAVDDAVSVVKQVVEGYIDGSWDKVDVVYNEFKNTVVQNRIVEPFLPIPAEAFLTPVMKESMGGGASRIDEHGAVDYLFEPNAADILEVLVPKYLNFQLWRGMLESNAAEQGARMVAMDNATTNAGELLDSLKLTYNQARQAAITTEILEIVGGAEALAQN